MADEVNPPRANVGYAFAQLAKALASTGETAAERLRQWQQIIAGMAEGRLSIGSRTPVGKTPAWVTLEVAHGGFATGGLAAGGSLQSHEAEQAATLGVSAGEARLAVNLHYAGETGRPELAQRLRDGCYRVNLPEEAALLIVSWLLQQGEAQRAQELLAVLMPYFDRLRFFPVPHPRPAHAGDGVCLQDVGTCITKLRQKQPHGQFQRMREAIQVWAPLCDRAVALMLETVEGDVPTLLATSDGELIRGRHGNGMVQGGWPCKHYPDGWRARAQRLLDDYVEARARHYLCGKPDRPKENFARLRGYLERCVHAPAALMGRDVGAIRRILASYVWRHGLPGSQRLSATREEQRRNAAHPGHHLVASLLRERLRNQPLDEGLTDPLAFVVPLAPEEARQIGAAAGEPVPKSLARRIERCLEAPLAALVERRLVSSAEVMARLVPGLTALVRASAIADPDLRRVYAAVYAAFRRRRSLLLLDLESQVRFDELPWVATLSPWAGSSGEHRGAARQALVEVATLAITTFPYTILPNPLVKELRALAASAGATAPFVEELAADIFMGAFSEAFLRAAQIAGRLLEGSLYERYYGLGYRYLLDLNDVAKSRFGAPTSSGFAALCTELAGLSPVKSVAANGVVIEQAQILTTHNLALLFGEFGLAASLRAALPELSRRCFEWVVSRHQMKIIDWKAQMQMTKNTAFAWRQMVFYLSLCDRAEVAAFLAWASERLGKCRPDFRERFTPALVGLRTAVHGHALGPQADDATLGRKFLGWSVGRHWLLPKRERRGSIPSSST